MRKQTHNNKRFIAYCALLVVSTVAWSFALVALPFQALDLPYGKQLLASAVLLGLVPRLLAPLLAPWLKNRLMGVNVSGAVAAMIAILQTSLHMEPALIQLAYVLLGINVVLDSTTSPLLVRAWFPQKERMRANALVGMITLGIPIVAWPLAGFISSLLGSTAVLGFATVGFLVKAVVSFVAIPPRAFQIGRNRVSSDKKPSIFSYAPLLLIVLVALGWLGYLQVAVPAMVDRLPRPETVYGWYGGAFSLGMAAGAGTLFVAGNRIEPTRALGLAGFLLPAAVLMYTIPSIGFLLAAGGMYGLGLGVVQTAGATYLQEVFPESVLALVLTWVTSATAAASMVGAAVAGLILEQHVRLAIWVAALQASAVVLWGFGRGNSFRVLGHDLKTRLSLWSSKERR